MLCIILFMITAENVILKQVILVQVHPDFCTRISQRWASRKLLVSGLSLETQNSFFLVVPERAFYCPNFLLDLQHLRMETLETSDAPSARNAASEAWDHLPEKKKTQWNLSTVKTSCYPEMWKLISNQFSRQQPYYNFCKQIMTLDSCCCPSYLVSFAFKLDTITNMLQSRNSTITTQPITFNSGF